MKNKLLICYLIVMLMLFPIASAAWIIHSSWSLNVGNTIPISMTTNATATVAGDVWIADYTAKRIFHYGPTGTYKDNFSVSNFGVGNPLAILVNATDDNAQKIILIEQSQDYIWALNSTGSYKGNTTLSLGLFVALRGMTSDRKVSAGHSYWGADVSNKRIVKINAAGTQISSCSVTSYINSGLFGIATNATNAAAANFWTCSADPNKCYMIDQNCVLKESINLESLGIAAAQGIDTYYKNTTVNDLLIVSGADLKVYRLTKTDAKPEYSGQKQRYTYMNFTNTTQLNVTCTDDIDVAYAYLADNSSGTWANCSSLVCNSPITFTGTGNTSVVANFSWIDLLTSSSSSAVQVNWTVQCVDSTDHANVSAISGFKATPMQTNCYGTNLNVSSVSATHPNNVSVTFIGKDTANCVFYMPAVIGTATNVSCPYKASSSSKVHLYNSSATSCVVNATFTDAPSNLVSRIDIATELSEVFPPNIPIAIAALAAVGIIYVVTVVRRKRRSE